MKITDTRKKIITYLKTKRWVKEERDKLKKEKMRVNRFLNQKQKNIDYFLKSNTQKLIKAVMNEADIQEFEEAKEKGKQNG
jgi:hypothetical protein|tara:strand:+ start:671 stop:913 length:243 start_codon:yes stop_codon:yes gene_type:complete